MKINEKEYPLVSVGLPTYNRPEGLQYTLEMLSKQSYKNLQIIISDNCSLNPKVKDIAEKFVKNDARFSFFQQLENKGPAYNFEYVLKKANGKYFMWATDDDVWETDFIKKLISNFDKNPTALSSFCYLKEINQNDEEINSFKYSQDLSSDIIYNRLKAWVKMKDLQFGKSSLIFGIHKTDVIKKIFFAQSQNYYGLDNIIVLDILLLGGIAIKNDFLYSCKTNNIKYYEGELSNNFKDNDTFLEKIKKGLNFNKKRNDYFNLYAKKISDSNLKLLQILTLTSIIKLNKLELFFKDCFSLITFSFKKLIKFHK